MMMTTTLLKKQRFSMRLKTLFVMLVSLTAFNSIMALPTGGSTTLQLGDFDYTLNESAKTLTIDLYKGAAINGELIIPSNYTIGGENYTVTAIGYAVNPSNVSKNGFRNLNDANALAANITDSLTANLTNVILPNTLKIIGCYAFYECSNLNNVIIPASVTTISIAAFRYSVSAVSFEDESQLDSLAKNALRGAEFTLPTNRTGYTVVWSDNGTPITDAAKLTVTPGTNVYTAVWSIPGTLTLKANDGVSSDQVVVTSVGVEMPLPVDVFTKDGSYLKGWAQTALGDIYSSNGTAYTPSTDNEELFAIWETIPADFTPEREVLNLSEVPYSLSDTMTISTAQGYTGDGTDIYIPSTYVIEGTTYTLVEIGKKTFQGKSTLTNVVLPSTLKVLGHTSFTLTGLDSIIIPANVNSLVARAFKGCPNLSKVIIEEESQLSSLGIEVFEDCSNLPSFTLPSMRTGYAAVWSNADGAVNNLVIPSGFAAAYTAVWGTATGIKEENLTAKALTVSPNPVAQSFTLNVQPISTTIYNLSGKSVKQFPVGTTHFDISSLESGAYFIKVKEADGRVSVEQLIKQ